MKVCSKFLSILLSVCMVATMLVVPAFAGDYTVEMAVSEDTVKVGDEVTVTISNKDMTVAGFGFALDFDEEALELISILGSYDDEYLGVNKAEGRSTWVDLTTWSTLEEANASGLFAAGLVGANDVAYVADVVAKLTFKALAEGTVTLTLTDKSASLSASFEGVAQTEDITIESDEPAHECVFGDWQYDDEEHWKECECGEKDARGDHEFGEWVETTPPQVGVPGEETCECECGKTMTRPVDALEDDTTGGSTTGGSTTGGSTTGGSTTGGSTTGGSTTGGSTTGGSTTGGSTTGGSTTGGSTTGGSTTGGSTTGGATTGGSTTGGSTTGGSTTGGATTGGSTVVDPVGPAPSDDPVDPVGFKYVDVDGHWCEDLIYKWTEKGVINGVGDNRFDPNGLLTRAQAAAIFTRWLGLEETADISCFTDVSSTAWYADYVSKCYAAGIVKGKAADKFAPNDYITRAEMFTMLCRALNIEGQGVMIKNFTDADQIPAWAQEYTNALVNSGYVSGMTETTLAPLGNLTRAQMVKLMDNLEGLVK